MRFAGDGASQCGRGARLSDVAGGGVGGERRLQVVEVCGVRFAGVEGDVREHREVGVFRQHIAGICGIEGVEECGVE